MFEAYAEHTLIQSNTEVVAIFNRVTHDEREAWIEYANATYEDWVEEGHLIETGSLDDLNPQGYTPDITGASPNGFIPEKELDEYFVCWNWSPPPFTYGAVNWNARSVPDYAGTINAILELKNETMVTRVRNYASKGLALKEEEHQAMHSKLPESQVENPHSFLWHPIHEDISDYNSKIVAVFGVGMAWDASLLNLLPENVVGIFAVVRNNCNESHTYEINGKDAIYQGAGDFHDPKFDDYESVVDLALHTHPNFTTTPGHCMYSMVRQILSNCRKKLRVLEVRC